ncbi:MAG: toxin-antitoxin system, antitoxin component, Xre family protein [Mogibacterium diversum]|nr:hypothetical protein [Mogibacterium diversum]MBF1359130.1 toxin-antitoxin system, antitoxin component, Xre family protein [Mogibacterium diversum]
MINSNALRDKIETSGLKYKYLAEQLDISSYGLQLKIDGKNEFLVKEAVKLCNLLNLTNKEREDIFFNDYGD